LEQHMDVPHTHQVHEIRTEPGNVLAETIGRQTSVSCFHHQRVRRLGDGLRVAARADDRTVEAATRPDGPGWFLGIQWHPQDTAADDPAQLALFSALVNAGAKYRA